MEDLQSEDAAFDLVVSSMALHYVDDYAAVVRKVFAALRPGGRFVFSVEHPVCTAHPAGWVRNAQGEALYWPLDDYQRQGRRSTAWFVDGVVKFHRTVEHYVNTLIERGFRLEHLGEPRPLPACLAERPALQETMRRPPVLLLAACR
ncbi:methyltransferase domain-containing protein [Corticibacter populi]|uniref:methyltransferase domain-containing protein n=1 Tax=Corticibacter populi TaxID=1550736 RepID=UPI001F5FA06B|nr:methyltransferase domain-containing protein [Corticibacter populi]